MSSYQFWIENRQNHSLLCITSHSFVNNYRNQRIQNDNEACFCGDTFNFFCVCGMCEYFWIECLCLIFCGLFLESEFMNWMYFVIDCLIGQNGRSNKTDRGSAPCSLPTKVQNPRWWILMNEWYFLCTNKCFDVYSIIEQVFGARVGKFAEDKNFKVKIWLFLFWINIISINVSLF